MKQYVITITELAPDDEEASNVIRYQQTIDTIDIQRVISAVNAPVVAQQRPPPPVLQKKRAKRSDAGKPRRKRVPIAENPLTREKEETPF